MKTRDEIYALGTPEYGDSQDDSNINAFYDGYTRCQEDLKEYIFQVAKEFHRLGKYSGNTSDTHFSDIYDETIKSLNKQE